MKGNTAPSIRTGGQNPHPPKLYSPKPTEAERPFGDIHVLFHEGLYHLFHLVLPNHAVSAMNRQGRTANNLIPPPKRLCRADEGVLFLKTFEGFDEWVEDPVKLKKPALLLKERPGHKVEEIDDGWTFTSEFGFQAFILNGPRADFLLDCHLAIDGKGKCGFVFRLNEETHDGYYLSLDLLKESPNCDPGEPTGKPGAST